MDIIHSRLDEYMAGLSRPEDSVLLEMEERANRHDFPIIGPQVGRVLFQLATISGARRILELGSGYGYSAYWFGTAMGEKGEITLTEYSQENLDLARDFLSRGGIRSSLNFRCGDALEVLGQMEGTFDIILNDIDKSDYPKVVKKARSLLRTGGMLITDNVLWSGRVVEPDPNEETRGVLEYTRLIYNDPGLFSTILPIRDGVSVSVKI